ncbi:MAG: 3'-5' exonuclease [Desulfomonilaceae bacterium]|nr:3'-5' exonuclease [Desulfomonilaceae bacterium]
MKWRQRWSLLGLSPRPKHPLIEENEKYFSSLDQNKHLRDCEFVCFDTELTGLNPRRDEIVAIGAVRITGLSIVPGDTFFTYVRPTRPIPKDSTLVHRITSEQLKDAPDPEKVLPAFVAYVGPALLLGHYVQLDVNFLNRALKKYLGGIIRNPCLDSMKLAQAHHEYRRRSERGYVSPYMPLNLGLLAKEYDLPKFAQHDALGDAMQTAYLFLFLVTKLQEAGYVTLNDLYSAGKIPLMVR